ncbi:Alpha alpha-trehalose-phosphate synthase [UDP-forming] [Bienertia sinuspersici]
MASPAIPIRRPRVCLVRFVEREEKTVKVAVTDVFTGVPLFGLKLINGGNQKGKSVSVERVYPWNERNDDRIFGPKFPLHDPFAPQGSKNIEDEWFLESPYPSSTDWKGSEDEQHGKGKLTNGLTSCPNLGKLFATGSKPYLKDREISDRSCGKRKANGEEFITASSELADSMEKRLVLDSNSPFSDETRLLLEDELNCRIVKRKQLGKLSKKEQKESKKYGNLLYEKLPKPNQTQNYLQSLILKGRCSSAHAKSFKLSIGSDEIFLTDSNEIANLFEAREGAAGLEQPLEA